MEHERCKEQEPDGISFAGVCGVFVVGMTVAAMVWCGVAALLGL